MIILFCIDMIECICVNVFFFLVDELIWSYLDLIIIGYGILLISGGFFEISCYSLIFCCII